MAQPGDEVEQDLSHIHWSWPEAIAANPARSLATADLAMDYFAYSPFWDTKSNNNVLRTQRRVENPTYGHAEEKHELNAFTSGFEYVVAHSLPPELFVVHRREVESTGAGAGPGQGQGRRNTVSGAWFILQDKVYQCPTLFDVVSTRLKNAAALVSKTLGTLSESRPPSNPRAPTIWRALPPSVSAATTDQEPPSSSSSTITPEATANKPAENIIIDETNELSASAPDPAPDARARADGGNDGKSKSTATVGASGAAIPAPTQPDWHLFHALQSTRASLASLDEMARTPVPPADPKSELRLLEAQLQSQFAPTLQQQQQQQQRQSAQTQRNSNISSRPNSVRSTSLLGLAQPTQPKGGMSPAIPFSLGAGIGSPARFSAGGPLSPANVSVAGRAPSVTGAVASPMSGLGAWAQN